MYSIFQSFVDGLADAHNAEDLRTVFAEAATALGLSCFAYLSFPERGKSKLGLISNYPADWTKRYLCQHYEQIDPVIRQASETAEPFEWSIRRAPKPLSPIQVAFMEDAARFGIRCGFTVPVRDSRGAIAAITFATDERNSLFERCVQRNQNVLQLMAMYFHAHARRRFTPKHVVGSVELSPRELECLEWAACGKSAWEIGRILNISRRTAAFHLDNAKAKLGVRTICQAVAKLTAARSAHR